MDQSTKMTDKNPLAHYSGVLSEAVQESAAEQIPASGQSRFHGQKWAECSVEHVAMVLAAPHEWKGYEVRYLYAAPVQAAPAAVAVPAKLPTSDEIRAIARSVSTSSSDSPSPSEYVMAGYRAALAVTTGDHVAEARNILEPRQNHLPNCRDDACLECSSLIPDEWVNKTPAFRPVVLPEPVAWLANYEDREGNSKSYTSTHKDLAQENDTNGEPQSLFTEQQVRALLAGVSAPAAQVIVDFEQIGSAGPFPVVNGRVKLPEVTMVDLARMLKPTTDVQAQADAQDAEQYRLLQRGQDTIQADDEFLREDGVTWRKDPSGIFVGAIYEGNILLPARRAIAAQAAKGE